MPFAIDPKTEFLVALAIAVRLEEPTLVGLPHSRARKATELLHDPWVGVNASVAGNGHKALKTGQVSKLLAFPHRATDRPHRSTPVL